MSGPAIYVSGNLPVVNKKTRWIRLRMCWAILRGWPVAYRLDVREGTLHLDGSRRSYVVECKFLGEPHRHQTEEEA